MLTRLITKSTVTLWLPKGRIELTGLAAIMVSLALAGALGLYLIV